MNVPDAPGASVDGDTNAEPRPRTSPRFPYQVRATATSRAVTLPVFRTLPFSVTVPLLLAVRVSDVRSSGRADGGEPAETAKLTLA